MNTEPRTWWVETGSFSKSNYKHISKFKTTFITKEFADIIIKRPKITKQFRSYFRKFPLGYCICVNVKRFAIACVLLHLVALPALSWISGNFGENYFINHQKANTIQLFVSRKRKFFGSGLQNKSQSKGNSLKATW